jgi:hypothetical protein
VSCRFVAEINKILKWLRKSTFHKAVKAVNGSLGAGLPVAVNCVAADR